MSRRTLDLAFASASAFGLVACPSRPPPELVGECRALGRGTLETALLRVMDDGRVPPCDGRADATATFVDSHAALVSVPSDLRPRMVTVLLSPAVERIEYDPLANAIRVNARARTALGRAAWLHEFAHARARGPRPRGVGSRVVEAAEEGVADYFAAIITGDANLGGERDLRTPPARASTDWAMLALPGMTKDVHDLGWQLAAELWAREPSSTLLLADLIFALSAPAPFPEHADTPGGALGAFLERCPARSRPTVRSVFRSWVPRELFPE